MQHIEIDSPTLNLPLQFAVGFGMGERVLAERRDCPLLFS